MVWRSTYSPFAFCACLAMAAVTMTESAAFAQIPLRSRIDSLIGLSVESDANAIVSDEEFARRLFLDLTGAVPSAAELKEFLANASPDKRTVLVDRLLASPQYARHMAITFDVMLMERRPEKHVKADEWHKYLYDSFLQNKPWNKLVRELLDADGTDEKIRPAARFYLDREGEPNALTRDIGRMFFGMDLSCCQCHDHPLVNTYMQADYYGIYAFLSRGALITNKDKKVFYAERAEGDVKFTSVFTKKQDEMRPRLPGEFEINEPLLLRGDDYLTPPGEGIRSVPKYSRRAKLAEAIGGGSNRQFSRNIANRLWALMMGRGLVEPMDMHHADNPASNPELLEWLADEFVQMNFDIKAFLREIALSRAYQQPDTIPADDLAKLQSSTGNLADFIAEYERRSQALTVQTEAIAQARAEYESQRKLVIESHTEFAKANEAVAAANKPFQDAAAALSQAIQQAAAKKEVSALVADAATKFAGLTEEFPQDARIAEAAQKIKTRGDQLSAEIVAAEKLVADRTPVVDSAKTALAAAKAAAAPAMEKVAAAQQKLPPIEQRLQALLEPFRFEQTATESLHAKVLRGQLAEELAKGVAALEKAAATVATIDQQLATNRAAVAAAAAQLPNADVAIQTASGASGEAEKRLTELRAQLADKQQIAATLNEAADKTEIVAQKLAQDAELKQTANLLRTRRQQFVDEVASRQAELAAAEQAAKDAASQLAAAQEFMKKQREQLDTMQKELVQLESQLASVVAARDAAVAARNLAEEKFEQDLMKRFRASPLEPLTPEQMAWSILKVTGVVDQYRAAAIAEIDKAMPLDANAALDLAKIADREQKIEQNVYDKLKGNVAVFVQLFGHAGGQPQRDFFATVDQALFFSNGGVLQSWLNPGGENLVARAIKQAEPQGVASELYLGVLTRQPTDDEVAATTNYLAPRANDRAVAIQEIAWALITSTEFRFQ